MTTGYGLVALVSLGMSIWALVLRKMERQAGLAHADAIAALREVRRERARIERLRRSKEATRCYNLWRQMKPVELTGTRN